MKPFVLLVVVLFTLLLALLVGVGRLPLLVAACYGAASCVAFGVYAWDKAAARRKRRRVPERILHLLGLAGGWPGAALAQQTLRHKTRKRPFLQLFWLTAIANGAALAWLLFTAPGLHLLRAARHLVA